MLANRNLGKKPLTEDPLPNPWEPNTIIEQTELVLRANDAKVLQLEVEMRRMQQTIDELQSQREPQPTPVRRHIATPQTPKNDSGDDMIDFNHIKNAKKEDRGTIVAGVRRRPRRSPETASSSECGDGDRSTNGTYQIASGGGDQSGGGDDDHGDDGDGNRVGAAGSNWTNNVKSQYHPCIWLKNYSA